MAPELQQYYEQTFSTMATQGWSLFVEDLEEIKKQVSDISTVKDDKHLNFRLGQLDILNLCLQRKAMCEKVYSELLEDAN